MKVLYPLITIEADEPLATAQLKAGYNAVTGSDFDNDGHTVDVIENFDLNSMTESLMNGYINDGYELICYNSNVTLGIQTILSDAKLRGLLCVIPVGTNNSTERTTWDNKQIPVLCGSGLREYGNATGYTPTFFDQNPAEESGYEIKALLPTGVSYNVTKIQRRSSSLISIKLEGITNIQTEIGLPASSGEYGYYLPVYFSNVSGSDISPLPDGRAFTSYVGNNFIFVLHETTDGTIDTGFSDSDYQNTTGGTILFGTEEVDKSLMFLDTYLTGATSNGITLQNITGFDSNPDGKTSVFHDLKYDGRYTLNPYGNTILLNHDLGSGTLDLTTDPKLYFISQSYSTPYIAGLLMGIKINAGCSWDEAIGRAIKYSSESSFDNVNGYGYINYNPSSDSLLDITLDAPVIEITEGAIYDDSQSITVTWDLIKYATAYELYQNETLIQTVTSNTLTITNTIPRLYKGIRSMIKLRAINDTTESEFSNEIEVKIYKYARINVTAKG